MKKNEVKIGGTYTAKVNGKVAKVRIDAENPHGGWDATNLETKRKVRIKTAQRLRAAAGSPTSVRNANSSNKSATKATGTQGATGAKQGAQKTSCLDAAAKVLAETRGPMNTKELIEAMAAKGYWKSPGGKTPHSTLYAAIAREIAKKGDQSRFKKAEKGKFALA